MKTNKKGISLIVLIITIIVMIILAAAVILYLDETKVVKNAKKAVTANDVAVAKEVVTVARAEWRMNKDKITAEYPDIKTFKSYAENKLKESGFTIGNNGGEVQVSENGLVYAYLEPIIPEGFTASRVSTEDEVAEGLVIYEGVDVVTDSNHEEAMKTRNQFVWVPVPNMSEFVRKEYNSGELINLNTSYRLDVASEDSEYLALKESVAKYGGFYIARYEAGTGVTRTDSSGDTELFIQKNKNVYNFVRYTQAKDKCSTLTTESVVGHLLYGEEWDAALTFIATSGAKDANYSAKNQAQQQGWYNKNWSSGNPNLLTGVDVDDISSNMLNNIYDMSGMVFEWTNEYVKDKNHRIVRGGHYEAASTGAGFRGTYGEATNRNRVGFRPALYIK